MNSIPLVFVWLGEKLPRWYYRSLDINLKTSKTLIYIISSKNLRVPLGCINIVLSDFYKRPDEIIELERQYKILKKSFFWIATFERFFVLKQFLILIKQANCIGAELDNIVFDPIPKYNFTVGTFPGHSFFYPRLDSNRALGSIFFVNDITGLQLFEEEVGNLIFAECSFNDMTILSLLLEKYPNKCMPLPSFESFCLENQKPEEFTLYDAALLGQHILGVDPKIVSRPLFNFGSDLVATSCIEEKGKIQILDFIEDFDLKYISNGIVYSVGNIHLHSKSFRWLTNPLMRKVLICQLTRGQKTLISLNLWNLKILRYIRSRFRAVLRIKLP